MGLTAVSTIKVSSVTLADLKGPKENITCTMDDVRGDFLGPPHGTKIANKN